MTTKKIEIVADVNEPIRITALELTAIIRAILIDRDGVQYRVTYFHEGKQETAYVFADEITRARS